MAEFPRREESSAPASAETDPPVSAQETVDQLQQAVAKLERTHQALRDTISSCGCPALDALLPEQGFAPGSLIEWLADGGCGASVLALIAAREAMRSGGALVVLDRGGRFHPPAAAALGVELENLVVIRAANESDELWALDQALRCPGVAAAWAELQTLDWRWFRRLQLAAEEGGALGLLQRPPQVRGQPTWAAVQLLVRPTPFAPPPTAANSPTANPSPAAAWRLRVEVVRCRGGRAGGVVKIELDDVSGALRVVHDDALKREAGDEPETHALHLAAQLARATSGRRSARA